MWNALSKKLGYEEKLFSVETTDISTAKAVWPDIFVTSSEFAKQLMDQKVPVVVVKNLFDEKEISAALAPVFQKCWKKKIINK